MAGRAELFYASMGHHRFSNTFFSFHPIHRWVWLDARRGRSPKSDILDVLFSRGREGNRGRKTGIGFKGSPGSRPFVEEINTLAIAMSSLRFYQLDICPTAGFIRRLLLFHRLQFITGVVLGGFIHPKSEVGE